MLAYGLREKESTPICDSADNTTGGEDKGAGGASNPIRSPCQRIRREGMDLLEDGGGNQDTESLGHTLLPQQYCRVAPEGLLGMLESISLCSTYHGNQLV